MGNQTGSEHRHLVEESVGDSRSATASPGRSERWGVWGAMSGPPTFLVAVELDGVAIRIFDVDGRAPAPADDPHASPFQPVRYLLPLLARIAQAEVIESARFGVEGTPGGEMKS